MKDWIYVCVCSAMINFPFPVCSYAKFVHGKSFISLCMLNLSVLNLGGSSGGPCAVAAAVWTHIVPWSVLESCAVGTLVLTVHMLNLFVVRWLVLLLW